MYRQRLRPAWDTEFLTELYAEPHDAGRYGYGHHLRVEHTIALGRWFADDLAAVHIADLSCGNGAIATAIAAGAAGRRTILGDFAPGYDHTGPIEATLDELHPVDLFILSETVEHLDDPDTVLARIAGMARGLLLSTPIGETDDHNREHYWGWDQDAVAQMLNDTGWTPTAHVDVLLPDTYSYQLWAARSSAA